MTAKPYTPEELDRWRKSYPEPDPRLSNDHAMWASRYDQRFIATIDALKAELARYKSVANPVVAALDAMRERDALKEELARLRAAVPADVAGLAEELRHADCPVAGCDVCKKWPYDADLDPVEFRAAAALEAQARELSAKDEAVRLEIARRAALVSSLDEALKYCRDIYYDNDFVMGRVRALETEHDPAARALLDDIQRGRELAEAVRELMTKLPRCGDKPCGRLATKHHPEDSIAATCDEHGPHLFDLIEGPAIRRIAELLDATETKKVTAGDRHG